MIGGRVHGARYPGGIVRFVRDHLDALRSRPSAFFSVSLLQLSPKKSHRADTLALPGQWLARVGWKPDRTEVFAGALSWTRYGFVGTLIMKLIWQRVLGKLDTSRDQVFTDWPQVDNFADEFIRFTQSCTQESRVEQPAITA